MQWMDIQIDWKSLSKAFKAKWTKLTDADLTAIAGKREELIKRLAAHYKTDKAKLEKEIEDFIRTLKVKS